MRPATAIVETVKRFDCEVFLCKGDLRVSTGSPLDIVLLVAEKGDEVTLEATGPDAAAALDALAEVFERTFGENEIDYQI
jgi:phosphotransferase system HPr (HPr) family protein